MATNNDVSNTYWISMNMCVCNATSAYSWLLWFPMFILNVLIGASCDCSEVFAKQMAYTPATRKALTAKDAKHTAKRKKALRTIGSQRCAMLPANTRREAYIAFGGGFWAWCPKATTRLISDCRLSFMQLCYDQIATQPTSTFYMCGNVNASIT